MGIAQDRDAHYPLEVMSWSKHWDSICAEARAGGPSDTLLNGRAMELRTLGLVLFPERIQVAWEAGEFGQLGYLAEALAAWPPRDLEHTDPVLFQNVQCGLAVAHKAGWPKRLNAVRLHELESVLDEVLTSQRAEGIFVASEEVAEVRRRLAKQHLSSADNKNAVVNGGL